MVTVCIYIKVSESETKFYPVTSLDVSGVSFGSDNHMCPMDTFASEFSVVHLRPRLYTA